MLFGDQVALKKVVDDVSVLVVEHCLIKKLPLLFDPVKVNGLEDQTVRRMAAEHEGTVEERKQLHGKVKALEQGHKEMQRLDKHKVLTQSE